MQRVYQAAGLQEAYLLAGLLAQHGIPVRILNEYAKGGLGEIPFTHAYPELWVMDDHLTERARQLVERWEREQRAHATDENVTCRACGESNPANFELCWACGHPLH